MSDKWVCSKFDQEQTEKWEVVREGPLAYHAYDRGIPLALPKSSYHPCSPPERWQRVTSECELRVDAMGRQQIWHNGQCIDGATGYRFQKIEAEQILPAARVHVHAFIVERKQPDGSLVVERRE